MKRLSLPLLAIALILAGCGREEPRVTVASTPAAAVWQGDELLGRTPLELPVAAEDRELTLRLPGYRDADLTVPSGSADEAEATLEPIGGHTLTCTSTPTGASVFLDGERLGETPLVLRDLERDVVDVTFRLKNHEQVSQTVRFGDQPQQELAVVLPSLTEKYYIQRIRNEPDSIHPYCDLAHYYVLAHEFGKAMTTFGQGVDLLARAPNTEDAARLWSEIDRVTTKQYDYGNSEQVAAARKALAEELDRCLKQHGAASPIQLYTSQITLLDTLNRRQQAQNVFDEAWKHHRGDRTLQRLAKQRRFVIP
jgi:hypothetical protein